MSDENNYLDWIEFSDRDIDTAKFLTTKFRPPLEIICWLGQQAVEKSLKAFLVKREITPRKIHDLKELCAECAEFNADFSRYLDQCNWLTLLAMRTRYPDKVEIIATDMQQALKFADEILAFIKEKLG